MIPVMGRMWMPLMSYGRSDLNIARTAKGSLTLTGHAPSIFVPYTAATGVGALSISGYVPTVGVDTPVSAGAGALTIAGYAPTITNSSDDAFADYVELLVHFNGDTLDYSGLNRTIGQILNPAVSASGTNPFGSGSYKWDGTAQQGYLTESDEGLQFGTDQDFTIEMWFKIYARANAAEASDAPLGLISKRNLGGASAGAYDTWGALVIDSRSTYNYEVKMDEIDPPPGDDRVMTPSTALDTWYFIAFCREGSTMRGYFGEYGDSTAAKVLEESTSYDYSGGDYDLYIGAYTNLITFNGWIYDVRITRAARYTGSTCPMPTEQFPNGSTRKRPVAASLTITGHAPTVTVS